MPDDVKTAARRRSYDASRRKLAADQTRRAIVDASRALFLARGYTATTMAAIAESAAAPAAIFSAARRVIFCVPQGLDGRSVTDSFLAVWRDRALRRHKSSAGLN